MKREIPIEQAHRLIAPGPVTLVTSFYRGDMNVMTASWLAPVSYRPVLISLSVHELNLTNELIRKGEEFAVNIPSYDLLRQVRYCAAVSGRDQNKLSVAGLREEGPHVVRPVLIQACIAHLECAVVEAITPGDHTIFVAEVVHAQAEAEAFDGGYLLKERDLSPLHHLGGDRYAVLGETLTSEAPLPDGAERG
jgi:flavin reductase (DIM6/NTAB) family NADH-FMN oxidoreductase RutF